MRIYLMAFFLNKNKFKDLWNRGAFKVFFQHIIKYYRDKVELFLNFQTKERLSPKQLASRKWCNKVFNSFYFWYGLDALWKIFQEGLRKIEKLTWGVFHQDIKGSEDNSGGASWRIFSNPSSKIFNQFNKLGFD